MEYVAKLSKEGRYTLIDFPDCDGCQTFADPDDGEDAASVARDALEGWLIAHLVDGEAPPQPARHGAVGRKQLVVRRFGKHFRFGKCCYRS